MGESITVCSHGEVTPAALCFGCISLPIAESVSVFKIVVGETARSMIETEGLSQAGGGWRGLAGTGSGAGEVEEEIGLVLIALTVQLKERRQGYSSGMK